MSALVLEPPALARSLKEGQRSSREPTHVLAQLTAALENPDIKALEWSEDGRGVLIHAELYEEEVGKNKELFQELVDLSCVAALQAWLLAYGFKPKEAKVNSQALVLQHPDFQRALPTAKELAALRDDAGLSAKQQKKKKKKKKKKCGSSLCPCRGAMSQDMLGLQPRLRPLYQYINFDMPELMHLPAGEDEVPGRAQPHQVPAGSGTAPALQLEDPWASSASEIPAPELGDRAMQLDIEKMLRNAAHLVPPLFPQYK